ncbi:MAG TPA: response regulator transcription factor [Hanamia sp.]
MDIPVKENNFDLILMDYSMPPGISGTEAIKLIKKIKPTVKILGVSSHTENCVAEDMINAGANGYFVKDSDRQVMAEAIKAVLSGEVYFNKEIM